MKRFALLGFLALSACGGGGSGVETTPQSSSLKISEIDGTWKSSVGTLGLEGDFKVYPYLSFGNGKIHTYGFLGSLNLSKDGTFGVSGTNLTYTLTKSYSGQNQSSLNDILNDNQSGTTAINETVTCSFQKAGNILTLTLTNPSLAATFTKQ